jgi:ferrochelatase
MMGTEEKRAVLLLAFGAADSLDDIEPFLKNILRGRSTPPELLARTLERYKLIGGRSPLLDITREQAKGIEEALKEMGTDCKVYVGMRFWPPYIKDVLTQMNADGIGVVTTIVMAPFTSPVATGGYDKVIYDTMMELKTPRINPIGDWHILPKYIDILVANLKDALSEFEKPEDALVIFSNHSLPRDAMEGDAYEMKIHHTVSEITKRMNIAYKIAFQSQGMGQWVWLGPKVEDVMEEAKQADKEGVVVVPLGFLADHVETLYDIDILFKEHAEALGLKFARSKSLNADPRFIKFLAELIHENKERFR